VVKGLGVIAVGMIMFSNYIEIKVITSIPVPTIKFVPSSLTIVLKSVKLVAPLECALASARVEVWTGIEPFAPSKTFTAPKLFMVDSKLEFVVEPKFPTSS